MKILHADEFDGAIKEGTVLVDFFADWCGPCKMLGPVVEKAAEKYAGKVGFCKVNVDESPSIAGRYGIMSIPTLIVFQDGQPKASSVGYMSEEQLSQFIDKAIG